MVAPTGNGKNGDGRDPLTGKFLPGNPAGPGNPHFRATAVWRNALREAVSPKDVKAVLRALVKAARQGEQWAVVQLLDRCLGRPTEGDVLERLEQLETLVDQRANHYANPEVIR